MTYVANTDRVVIAYLHPGQVSGLFCQSLAGLVMHDSKHHRRVEAVTATFGGPCVSVHRNEIVRPFLETRVEWLLFIDSDMDFGPDALDRLLEQADARERPIVGALYFQEIAAGGLVLPLLYVRPEDAVGYPRVALGPLDQLLDYPDDSLFPVAATGAGFLLIHRQVLEKIEARRFSAAFPWFQETEIGGAPMGEDATFCLRASEVGAPIHVDTGLRIGHHKSRVLTHQMFRDQQLQTGSPRGPRPKEAPAHR